MLSHHALGIRRKNHRHTPWLELMEDRQLLSGTPALLDPLTVPKFVNPLPQPLDPSFVYQPTIKADGTPHYEVGAYQIQEDLGLGLKDAKGNPVKTTVYGYGTSAATATYPGRTFVVQEGQPTEVHWTNGLTSKQHILPVDPTVLGPNSDANGKPYYLVNPATNMVTFKSGIPIVPHVHGGHTPAQFDGTPEQWFTSGGQQGVDNAGTTFTYPDDQQAATIWYHDHAMGVTRQNVYAGLAGFYIVHDTNENTLIANHTLPDEKYDIPLAIQDRQFTADGQLYYPADPEEDTTAVYPSVHPEFFGDIMLVNGQAWPALDVEPRMYRFRVLDGSEARFYNLSLSVLNSDSSPSFFQVGTDGGLLESPVQLSQLLVAPGERADIVVDFSQLAGKTIIVKNHANAPYPTGDPDDSDTTGQIMAFRVSKSLDTTTPDATLKATSKLNKIIPFKSKDVTTTRQLGLFETTDQYGRLIQKLGALDPSKGEIVPYDFMAAPTENVQLVRQPDGTQSVIEEWKIYNTTMDTHPIHLHQVQFQIMGRQQFTAQIDPATNGIIYNSISLKGAMKAPDPNEAGWKDTARMNPGEVTTIRFKFDLPGKYVWHCHILEHEEHDMMRPIMVLDAPQQPKAPAGTTQASSTTTAGTASARLSAALATTTPARFSAGAFDGADLPLTFLELGEVPPLLVPDTADGVTPAPITLSLRKGRGR